MPLDDVRTSLSGYEISSSVFLGDESVFIIFINPDISFSHFQSV